MKKTLALLLSLTLLLSLSACSMLKDIKENAERNAAREILETPAEADAPALFLDAVKNGFADAHVVKEHTSMEIGRPTVEGEGDVDLLNAAAGLLKDLIADGAPGSETREVSDIADTELQGFDPAGATETRLDRNASHEPVTDKDGNEQIVAVTELVTDENGSEAAVPVTHMVEDEEGSTFGEPLSETLTETKNTDNILKLFFRYFTETENGDGEKEYTPADEALLEKVFGAKRDKAEVLSHFEVVSDYFTDIDYTFTYLDPEVRAELDMDRTRVNSVDFYKAVRVTATATGVGKLAGVGTVTITFDLNEKTGYTFDYPVVE